MYFLLRFTVACKVTVFLLKAASPEIMSPSRRMSICFGLVFLSKPCIVAALLYVYIFPWAVENSAIKPPRL